MSRGDGGRAPRRALALIVAAYCLYAGGYIFQTSFVIDDVRYFSLFDDAMVSMRYARNLARGHGLVWNVDGPRVEGFTNLLWVCYMAGLHLLGLPTPKISLAVQLSGLVFSGATLFVIYDLALALYGRYRVALAAVVLTAFYLPLNTWGLQGMEVSALALLASASVWLALGTLAGRRRLLPVLYLVLGIATLVRLDMAVFSSVVLGFMLWADGESRRTHLAWGAASALVFMGGQTVFRHLYFGDALPNTYYLKMVGFPAVERVLRGAHVLLKFVHAMNWVLLGIAVWKVSRGPRGASTLLLAAFGGQCVYSVYVGGDAWEWWGGANRYLCVAVPLFFVVFAAGLADFIERFAQQRALSAYLVALLASLVSVNMLRGPSTLLEALLVREPLHVAENEAVVNDALTIRAWTTEGAKVAVAWAGASAYFADREMIDVLGKCDRTIAHLPMHPVDRFDEFLPGHLKWNYRYSIGELQPDIVYQLWRDEQAAMPWLERAYVASSTKGGDAGRARVLYIRKASPRVHWDRVSTMMAVRDAPEQ